MKILLINKFHYLRGGAERAYFDTARILSEAGHEVAFFSMQHPQNKPTEWESYFIKNVDYHTQYSIQDRICFTGKILWNFEAQRNLERLLEKFQPDIAHLHNIYHQISPSIIATLKKRNIPIVMTLHDYKLVCPNYSLFSRDHIWEGGNIQCILDTCVQNSFSSSVVCSFENFFHTLIGIYNKIDILLSPSKFLKEKFKERGFQKEITILSQPIKRDSVSFKYTYQKNASALYAGRLSSEKGVDVLLRAMVSVEGLFLTIAGDGPERKNLEKLSVSLGVSDRVRFLGHLSETALSEEMGLTTLVIIPSVWYENMPYALVEALGKGLIVIASRIGGITERIVDGENGFLFEFGNVKDLAHVMKKVLKQKNLENVSKKALQSVNDLEEKIYKDRLEEIYKKLLEKDAPYNN
ncbi:MAG: glycosyltransferase [Candidatus Moraniibacteriota bacterium]|nr:MAG: glycosyltransferase [Candidatus Moranbacteria bacterium]